jgi:hypothetical protein
VCCLSRRFSHQPHLRSGLGTQATTTTAVVWRSLRLPVLTQAQGQVCQSHAPLTPPAVLFRSWPTLHHRARRVSPTPRATSTAVHHELSMHHCPSILAHKGSIKTAGPPVARASRRVVKCLSKAVARLYTQRKGLQRRETRLPLTPIPIKPCAERLGAPNLNGAP